MKTKPALAAFLLALAPLLPTSGCGFTTPDAKLVLRVVDEEGQPVAGAAASVAGVFHEVPGSTAKGMTDTNGLFVATVRCQGSLAASVRKPGYYLTRMPELFLNQGRENSYENALLRGKWLPWGLTNTVVLKRQINPTAMLSGGGSFTLPAYDKPCGFDLERNDWVAPHGRGNRSDLVFFGTHRYGGERDRDAEVRVSFPSKYDGLIPLEIDDRSGSALKTPHQAPLDGYSSNWNIWSRAKPGQPVDRSFTINSRKRAYLLRFRSEEDGQGRLKRAWHGVILSEIEMYSIAADKLELRFRYYLNPVPNDRNLESDPNAQALSLKP